MACPTPKRRRRPLGLPLTALALLLAAGCALGCAGQLVPPPIVSQAELGRVIIYRNGVAYFERYAAADDEELTLQVPAERVDDFLKSLTVIDPKTGETMPVSYPTADGSGADVKMTIKLPEHHNRLRVSYVTESPAWKPTYRLVIEPNGKAKLQGWAVVDNVSGEDWKQVKVGVGSTSALSFRYDLHSVRLVERETLSSGSLLAVAPPTGGSPYASAGRGPRVMLEVDARTLAELDATKREERERRTTSNESDQKRAWKKPQSRHGAPKGSYRYDLSRAGHGVGGALAAGRPMASTGRPGHSRLPQVRTGATGANAYDRQPTRGSDRLIARLAGQLRSSNQQVRIEGFAQKGDGDPRTASLERANTLRNRLIDDGVDPNQIEAVGTGELNEKQPVRIVEALAAKPAAPPPADAAAPADGQPMGQAHFVSNAPMNIEADHSAMVSIINAEAQAERVYFYDPISARGSKEFAFNAVRLKSPSRYTLDSGPFTVYAAGQFLGEGLAEPILPGSVAFIPYALDRNIVVEPEVTGREQIDELLTIQRGVVSTESRRIRTTKLDIINRGAKPARVFVRHQVAPGYRLVKAPSLEIVKLGGAHLVEVTVPAKGNLAIGIEEWTPIKKSIDIRTDRGVKAIGLYLRKAHIGPDLAQSLRNVVRRHRKAADLEQRIELLGQQIGVYRTRVSEIDVQLFTLKKVPQAARLRRHLAHKMEEISNKLQDATMELSDLKAQLMTMRIDLEDKLAELTLTPEKKVETAAPTPAPAGKHED